MNLQGGNMKKIIVDIDGTICTQCEDYNNAKPIINRIEELNKLFESGVDIVYFTARGTETCIDWRKITEEQFKKWNVKYTKLLFGKPSGDLYIDDKAFTLEQLDMYIKLKDNKKQKLKNIIQKAIENGKRR